VSTLDCMLYVICLLSLHSGIAQNHARTAGTPYLRAQIVGAFARVSADAYLVERPRAPATQHRAEDTRVMLGQQVSETLRCMGIVG
jgi:hypothetical protein